MKIVLTSALLFLTHLIFGQSVVSSKKELTRSNLTEQALDKQYPVTPEVGSELPYSIYISLTKALQAAMGPDTIDNLSIVSTLYLNQQGKIDYLVYDFRPSLWTADRGRITQKLLPVNQDSLSRIISANLPKELDSFISKRHLGQKTKLYVTSIFVKNIKPAVKSKALAQHDSITNGFFGKGTSKPIVKKDSVIKNLTEALSVIDTLKIKELYLERRLFKLVPDVIYRFPNLELLSLLNNDIEQAEINMSKLPKLRHLDLTGNILSAETVKISVNKSLRLLNLQNNILQDIPGDVKNCTRLETLWLGRNKLSELNDNSFRKMKRLRDINLYKSGLAVVPKGIKKMRRLEVLDLYYNNLETLPASVTRLKRLTHLAVSNNQLTALPEKINKMKRLNILYAHHNHLSRLPGKIVKLKNLVILDLGFNWFTNFPDELTNFANLQELDLSSNNFTEFPAQLLSIRQLDKLFLRGNPFLQEDRETKYGQQFSQLKNKNIEVFY